ncbi:aminotransferase class V-fold PLP-dependent enzyme [Clostridium sartagoforme]|uniref:cysteine-S-conjugate beta-lyase n=1 Tax=Clostridium sartagoforme TaxID=84031 RepID=A0A4S2DSR9_9CLOT|nr:aminotransferase class I/II-fold pyridoxal phosphate-dependent enzyme [Clostridium sartagoforme]TGY44131.1 aminotransferase class V-fold PLP-dependent enzyme [Clostridium sartagoforme]
MKFGTKLLHSEKTIEKNTGAVTLPIYQSSTFHQFDIDNFGEYDYARSGNPTRNALEEEFARLESGKYAYAFSSGIAAISSVISTFSAGDHLIVAEDVYGGTYRAVTKLFNRFNIEFTFVDTSKIENIEKEIKENTKAIYLETPSNPLLKITDLKEAVNLGKKHNLLTIVDNTFMSPYLQRPLELGVDIVVHSATKFIGGHSDVIAGFAVTNDKLLSAEIYRVQNGFGAILSPQDCYLVSRGLKTLKIRMDQSQKNALELSKWLLEQEIVEAVYYPGIESHKDYEVHKNQSFGPGAVLSFKFKNIEQTKHFLNNVENVVVAVSLGAVETIVSYPVKMSHAAIPREEREKLGITDTLIRVSLGIEDIEDIIEGFKKGLLN